MNALASGFLWLLPLVFLPVIIHLLNRLRYRTVQWAAMMFLRTADRDASRRARIRQWIILALRCLLLLMFILALSRLQSLGRLARFFDPGSNLVIVLFDRSVSMEQQRGGVSGRERALTLVKQGLNELDSGTRVLWLDGATGEMIPIPTGIDPATLPQARATSTRSDLQLLVRRALEEVARADVNRAEVWIPTDRQSSAWILESALPPDWTDWAALQERVQIRLLDVGAIPADPGNRSLRLVRSPRRKGDQLQIELALQRDTAAPEAIPLQIQTGGLTFQEEILVEGEIFQWVQEIPLAGSSRVTHARFSLPADSNLRDHEVHVAWEEPGVLIAGSDSVDPEVRKVVRAAVLPKGGVREWNSMDAPNAGVTLWFSDWTESLNSSLLDWVQEGGILVRFPRMVDLPSFSEEEDLLEVEEWSEGSGIVATEGRDPLRLDLLRIQAALDLPVDGGQQVLATLTTGQPFLTRTEAGRGLIVDWATAPLESVSNLDDGFVLVPAVQRLLLEDATRSGQTGIREVGDVALEEEWKSLDGEGSLMQTDAGRYQFDEDLLAFNRPSAEDQLDQLSVTELKEWAAPLRLGVYEDASEGGEEVESRSEFTGLLGILGLVFLVAESWLLTRNIRKVSTSSTAWGGQRV